MSMQIHPIKIRIAKIQHVLTVCINDTTLEKKTYFEPDYSESKASLVVTAKPPQRECSPAECAEPVWPPPRAPRRRRPSPNTIGCSIRQWTWPAARSIAECRRLHDPSMNATSCSICRWTPPTALTYCRCRVQFVLTIYSLRWASRFRSDSSRSGCVVHELDGIESVGTATVCRREEDVRGRRGDSVVHSCVDGDVDNKWRFSCSHDLTWTGRLSDVNTLHV
jgi:hypothetical protein